MSSFKIHPPLIPPKGLVIPPGDKSIAHRCLILAALSCQKVCVENVPLSEDLKATITILKNLGITIKSRLIKRTGVLICEVAGVGLYGLVKPHNRLSAGESGTTIRLMLGLLSAQGFTSSLTAKQGLLKRPMHRVTYPLRLMGANIKSNIGYAMLKTEEYPPFAIKPAKLKGIAYHMPVASAQVKSAILLAGLYAQGKTTVIEKVKTRDHTERILRLFKANIKIQGNKIIVANTGRLVSPPRIYVPADLSSAAFFIVMASLISGAKITIKNVLLNPTRTGLLRVLERMGADIKTIKSQNHKALSWEPMGDLIVKNSILKGAIVKKVEIPSLIDELPILMVAASLAKGKTILKGVGELRVKETDRIKSMCDNLRKMGAKIKIVRNNNSEDIVIDGVKALKGRRVKSFGDHRTAMSMVVAGLCAKGQTHIDDASCINKSFPDFLKMLKTLVG